MTSLPRLLQLASASLPIGGYAYSDGLETAVSRGWIRSEQDALSWIAGRMHETLARCDLPLLVRLRRAATLGSARDYARWCDVAWALRDSAERRLAEREQGIALSRLLADLDVNLAQLAQAAKPSRVASFALASVAWNIDEREALIGYGFSFVEAQVAAAIKLVPLGQTAGQRILGDLSGQLMSLADEAPEVADDDLGSFAPGASLAAAWHESDRVRLFRS
jgi:urease accessory protein